MKLGFYTYSYIDRLKMEVEPVLEAVAAAGYAGIDISATWHDDLDPALMPRAARDRYIKTAGRLGLEVEAVVTHLGLVQAMRDGLPLNLPAAVDVARDVGAKVVTVHAGFADFLMGEAGRVWRSCVEHLRTAAAYAGRHGVVIALDGVWRSFLVDTPDLAVRLTEEVGSPAFRHNFDPCYLALSGHDPAAAAARLAPVCVHAHVKDFAGSYPEFEHRIPGEGVLDHAGYMRALAAAGYDRYLIVECFIDAPLDRALAVGRRTLSAALDGVGVR